MSNFQTDIQVDLEFTPNPNTLKYVPSVPLLLAGAFSFKNREAAEGKSPLAIKLFDLGGISAVMVAKAFVTVTLATQDSLTELNDSIIETIKKHMISGDKTMLVEALESSSDHGAATGDIPSRIIKILDDEIRPAVAMDGGDITFERFDEGIVYVHMKGACAGCPSSTATLKMGIENRLREAIPEVLEVVAI